MHRRTPIFHRTRFRRGRRQFWNGGGRLLGDGSSTARNEAVARCLTQETPKSLGDAAIANYRTVSAQGVDISHATFLDDGDVSTGYRVVLIDIHDVKVSHGY